MSATQMLTDYTPVLRTMRQPRPRSGGARVRVLTLFGTRPEVIKLAPVIAALEERPDEFETVNVSSGQHDSLARSFIELFGLRVDHDLAAMRPAQTPSGLLARVLAALDPLLERESPDLVLVQGDTTTTLAGALAAFHRRIAVGHVEAGLRSADLRAPFPEEMNRRLVTGLATLHFAATAGARDNLRREGVADDFIFVTGNPVVDAVRAVRDRVPASPTTDRLLAATKGRRLLVLTTHRRESFGLPMLQNLRALKHFLRAHRDTALVFPVHPNPLVVEAARSVLGGLEGAHLVPPLEYPDFIRLLSEAWLIVSDSGGVQEEAPSLGRPLLVLRERTERPEVLETGLARLVRGGARHLAAELEVAAAPGSWVGRVVKVENPFGHGDAGRRIAIALSDRFGAAARAGITAGGHS
jgi:UDP-N-acetylglucosamine 2-epimerase (non-hydrolysing)